ncbi:hypothetical protein FQN54_001023 [Arachnomyces sp. PD_36]|nr:hypothetical protein FQN54_001023 [Arachnomyces sp. PD_36]
MFTLRTTARLRQCSNTKSYGLASCQYRNYHHQPSSDQSRFFKVSEEVRDALNTGKPVVALETTIYTHGFPYPANIALASRLESVVRINGGIPATIGILNGVAHVGMSAEELIELATSAENKSALKVSRRDLGYICGLGVSGRKVFATGGLGGVHRGAESSMDISADLTELGRTPVAVISSGCKSFLDIPRTLEYLETEGVGVATFADGRDGDIDFPAFFTRDSGIKSPRVVRDEKEAAGMIFAQSSLQLSSGLHFANPVPIDQSIPLAEMDGIIDEAIRLAEAEGAQGSDNTPFILSKIKELSGGRSVTANEALIESNVQRGTKVAVELAKMELQGREAAERPVPATTVKSDSVRYAVDKPTAKPTSGKTEVLVAGSLAIDYSCDFAPLTQNDKNKTPLLHTSNPSIIEQQLGGVGQNVAQAAKYVGSSLLFCSLVADDLGGRTAMAALERSNIRCQGVQVLPRSEGARTAQYVAVNDTKKDLVVAMADMSIMETPESNLQFDSFWGPAIEQARPNWVVIDANWGSSVLRKWTTAARQHGARVAFEPVSTAKSTRLFTTYGSDSPVISASNIAPNHVIDLAAPNRLELTAMYTAAREVDLFDAPEWWQIINSLGMSGSRSRDHLVALTNAKLVDEGIPQQSIQLLPFIPCMMVKLGAQGVLLTQLLRPGDPRLTSPTSRPYILNPSVTDSEIVGGVYMRHFPPAEIIPEDEVVSVNGAGDTLLGVTVAGLAMESRENGPRNLEDIIPVAQRASVCSLKSKAAVSPDIASLGPLLRNS